MEIVGNIVSITISLNDLIQHYDTEISLNKGELPLLLFYQSLNGHPYFETFDDALKASERYGSLLKLGRKPQLYVKMKMKGDSE